MVEIRLEMDGQKTKWIESTGLEVISLVATIRILCKVAVNDVRVTVDCMEPINCSPQSVFIGDMGK